MDAMNELQRTAEWHAARLGHVTASRFSDVLGKPRGNAEWTDTAARYALELVGERLTGEAASSGGSAATEWGTAHEPLALAAYMDAQGVAVEAAPFVAHPLVEWVGGSPDGFVGDDGLVEVKCPYTTWRHLAAFTSQEVPREHLPQIQGLLWVTSRSWCDFVSYDPRVPDSCGLFVRRVDRDDAYIATMADRIGRFVEHINATERVCRAEQ